MCCVPLDAADCRVTRVDGVPVPGHSTMKRKTHDSTSQESVSLFVSLSLQKDG